MNKKFVVRLITIVGILCLTVCLLAFSFSVCDINDDEFGFQPNLLFVLPFEILLLSLVVSASQLAIELELLQSNSAILYLELHETSPPCVCC